MSLTTSMLTVLLMLRLLIMITPPLLIFYLWRRDRNQREHSVLRNFPILGKWRYIFEKMGPALRQYLFLNDNEAKPFSQNDDESVVIAGKYKSRIIGFGSERDFEAGGFYLQNALYRTGTSYASTIQPRYRRGCMNSMKTISSPEKSISSNVTSRHTY